MPCGGGSSPRRLAEHGDIRTPDGSDGHLSLAHYEPQAMAAALRGEHDLAAVHRRTAELIRCGWPS